MPSLKRLALAGVVVTLAACDGGGGGGGGPAEGVPGSSTATPAVTDAAEIELPASAIRTIATGLRIPWGLAFLPDGTALVTERGNQVPARDDPGGVARILSITQAGVVTEVQRLSEVDLRAGEGGLLGLAVSPNYATDRWVYVYYSTVDDNRIARLHLGEPPQPIVTGRMYASELGSKTYDELNVIEPGHNYGWPLVEGFSTDAQHTNPIATWTPTWIASPSGIAVLGDHVYVACLRGQALYRLDLDGRNPRRLLTSYGRLRTVVVAPDGSLWVTTSNRDQVGREDRLPQSPDGDRVLRITPPG